MSDRYDRFRSIVVTFFPMFIATLSLVTSIYNGYLNGRFVDLIQNNVSRVEYMRTCKETIEAYFMVKAKAGTLAALGVGEGVGAARTAADFGARAEASAAVARFGALGTWLANLRDENIRYKYTQ